MLLLFTITVQAQVDTNYVPTILIVELNDGRILTGEYQEVRNDSLFIAVEGNPIGFPVVDIVSMTRFKVQTAEQSFTDSSRVLEGEDGSAIWPFENPNYHRYLFAPSAFMMEQGEGYYQNILIVANQVSYAFTDWLTIGAGFEWISLFLGEPIVFITPKVGWKVGEKSGLGGGYYLLAMPSEQLTIQIPYGVYTYGSREKNFTLGAGMMIYNDGYERNSSLALTANYMSRLGNKLGFVFENWLVGFDGTPQWVGAPGLRIMQENSTFDLGAIIIPQLISEGGIPIPYVDFVYQF